MKVDLEYLKKEMNSFRGIMTNKNYTVKQVGDALYGLITVYARFKPANDEENEFAETIMQALTLEHDMRLKYRLQLHI